MDESWRKMSLMGSSDNYIIPRRHSTEQARHHTSSNNNNNTRHDLCRCSSSWCDDHGHGTSIVKQTATAGKKGTNNEDEVQLDFRDVFGGPPRTTLLLQRHRFSGDFGANSNSTTTTAPADYSAFASRNNRCNSNNTNRSTVAAAAASFYDQIFSVPPPSPPPSHRLVDYHGDDDVGRSNPPSGGRGCGVGDISRKGRFGYHHQLLLSTKTTLRTRRRRSSSISSSNRGGRILPSLNIPSSSTSWSSPSYTRRSGGGAELTTTTTTTTTTASVQTDEGFYDDIFAATATAAAAASDGGSTSSSSSADHHITNFTTTTSRYSKSKSKSQSKESNSTTSARSSAFSSQENIIKNMNMMSPAHDDTMLSSFASKLRPITIPMRPQQHDSSPPSPLSKEGVDDAWEQTCSHGTLTINPLSAASFQESLQLEESKVASSSTSINFFEHYYQHQSPMEDQSSSSSVSFTRRPRDMDRSPVLLTEDVFDGTPSCSSVVSSMAQEQSLLATKAQMGEMIMEKKVVVQGGRDESNERSFVIEMDNSSSNNRHARSGISMIGETEGAAAVEEAIAWAKEKFWNQLVVSEQQRMEVKDKDCSQNIMLVSSNKADRENKDKLLVLSAKTNTNPGEDN